MRIIAIMSMGLYIVFFSLAALAQTGSMPEAATQEIQSPARNFQSEKANAVEGMGARANPSDCGPQYPYPSYHNPFYDGANSGQVINSTMDWIMNLPSSIMRRVTHIIDKRFYPRTPATHGGEKGPEVIQKAPATNEIEEKSVK